MQNAQEKRISVIPANPKYDRSIRAAEKRMRVATYCRVSTELIQQESSYSTGGILKRQNRKYAELDKCGYLC